MVRFYLAYTAKINPEGASPVLTPAQIWTGLQRKVRNAHEFVPIITACTVVSEDEKGTIHRRISIDPKHSPDPSKATAEETVTSYAPTWIDFHQSAPDALSPTTPVIRNIVSDGPSGAHTDLNMTYTFDMEAAHISESDTAERERELAKFKQIARGAVEGSIKTIREMVQDGRIGGDGTPNFGS